MEDVGGELHGDFVGGAVAVEVSAWEVGFALGDAVVDEGVEGGSGHFNCNCIEYVLTQGVFMDGIM